MHLKKYIIQGLIAAVLTIGLGLTAITNSYAHYGSQGNPPAPTTQQVDFAVRTSDLMLKTLFAALTQEFDETTAANVPEGNHSISLIFNDKNRDMRLVGTVGPLRESDRPSDKFEREANQLVLTKGEALTRVENVDGKWYYRRSVPLTNFRSECSLCHVNYPKGPTPDRVGALILRIPVKS
jgi:hypothetical protein